MGKKLDLYIFIIVVFSGIFEILLGIYSAFSSKLIENSGLISFVVLNLPIFIYWIRDKKYTFGNYFFSNICSNIFVIILNLVSTRFLYNSSGIVKNLISVFIAVLVHGLIRAFFYQMFKLISYDDYDNKHKTDSIDIDASSIDNDEEYEYVYEEEDDE